MLEAISTTNVVALPITNQELGRGGGLFCPPTKIGLSNSPTTVGLMQPMSKATNVDNENAPRLLCLFDSTVEKSVEDYFTP